MNLVFLVYRAILLNLAILTKLIILVNLVILMILMNLSILSYMVILISDQSGMSGDLMISYNELILVILANKKIN